MTIVRLSTDLRISIDSIDDDDDDDQNNCWWR